MRKIRPLSQKQQQIKEIVQDVLEKKASEEIEKEERKAFGILKDASQTFLTDLQDKSNLTDHQSLIKQLTTKIDETNLFYSNMRSDSAFTREVLSLQHNFEKQLNIFMKRNIHLTWVDEKGYLKAFNDIATKEIYKNAIANEGRGNINPNVLEKITNNQKDMMKINLRLRKSAEARKKVYVTALKRYKDKKYYWKVTKDNHQKRECEYTDPKVTSSRGVIAEGYAGAVINEAADVKNDPLEPSLQALYKNHIQKDSIPAAVKGDIILKSDNSIQFAIKEGRFSTAKIGQYIKLAYNITQLGKDTFLTKKEFSLALPKLLQLGKTSDKIVTILKTEGNNKIEELIKVLLSTKTLGSKSWVSAVNMIKEL